MLILALVDSGSLHVHDMPSWADGRIAMCLILPRHTVTSSPVVHVDTGGIARLAW